jgi:hypothetical protein
LAVGQAILTPAFNLETSKAHIRFIIHVPGPDCRIPEEKAEMLYHAYLNALLLAEETANIKTIAFPALSIGIFKCPLYDAAYYASYALYNFCTSFDPKNVHTIYLLIGPDENTQIYKEELIKNLQDVISQKEKEFKEIEETEKKKKELEQKTIQEQEALKKKARRRKEKGREGKKGTGSKEKSSRD